MRYTLRSRLTAHVVAATLGLGSLLISGCSSESTDSIAPGTGVLQLQLTDAPFPFHAVERADLFVVRIDGKLADADSADAARHDVDEDRPHRNADPGRGWVTLATPNQSYNLLELQGGRVVNLGQTTLPTGTYRGFRLILDTDKSSITLKDGRVLTGTSTPGIKFPSAGRTGIKVVLDEPVPLTSGGSILVLDFDLGRSFVMRGHTIEHNGLLFKPVIRGTATDITGALTGFVRALTGTGTPIADATVEVLKLGTPVDDTVSANVIATTRTDSTGKYVFAFLQSGMYALRVTPPASLTGAPILVPSITITTGDLFTVPVVIFP